MPADRLLVFQREFLEELRFWISNDRKAALKVLYLVDEIAREPFTGSGKPEPLKHLLKGCWSRRITQEHRLVYLVRDGRIDFLQCRYHY